MAMKSSSPVVGVTTALTAPRRSSGSFCRSEVDQAAASGVSLEL